MCRIFGGKITDRHRLGPPQVCQVSNWRLIGWQSTRHHWDSNAVSPKSLLYIYRTHLCVCVCVCVRACTCMCMRVCTYVVCFCVFSHLYTHTKTHAHTYIHIDWRSTYAYIYMYIYLHSLFRPCAAYRRYTHAYPPPYIHIHVYIVYMKIRI